MSDSDSYTSAARLLATLLVNRFPTVEPGRMGEIVGEEVAVAIEQPDFDAALDVAYDRIMRRIAAEVA